MYVYFTTNATHCAAVIVFLCAMLTKTFFWILHAEVRNAPVSQMAWSAWRVTKAFCCCCC